MRGGCKRELMSVDRKTGEVLDGTHVLIPEKKRNGYEEFGTVNLVAEELMGWVNHPSMRGVNDFRVFLSLWGLLENGNTFVLNQAALGRLIGLSPVAVGRAVKNIIAAGLIEAVGSLGRGRPGTYRVPENIIWRGASVEHRQRMLKQRSAKTASPKKTVH